jgi:hypothetical protein
MPRQIRNRPGYTKRRTSAKGRPVFRWMRDRIATPTRGPVAGPSPAAAVKPRRPRSTPESLALTAKAASRAATTEVLRLAALSDPRFAGLDASSVHAGDMARLEDETSRHLSTPEVRYRLAREILERPELAELANAANLDALEYAYRQGGINFALARLGSGHESAYAHVPEPERTTVIAEAREFGELDVDIDPYGGVRLFADYAPDPALIAATQARSS